MAPAMLHDAGLRSLLLFVTVFSKVFGGPGRDAGNAVAESRDSSYVTKWQTLLGEDDQRKASAVRSPASGMR